MIPPYGEGDLHGGFLATSNWDKNLNRFIRKESNLRAMLYLVRLDLPVGQLDNAIRQVEISIIVGDD